MALPQWKHEEIPREPFVPREAETPAEAPQPRPVLRYAGFWRRVGALVVDAVILSVVSGIAGGVIGGLLGGALGPGAGRQVGGWVGLGIVLAIWWLYYAGFECSRYQATPGKMVAGAKITDMAGRRIRFGRATGRFFAKFISAALLFLGFLAAAFTPRRQAVHDLIARCLVLKA